MLDTKNPTSQTTPPAVRNAGRKTTLALLLTIVLLAAAAFMAGRLMNNTPGSPIGGPDAPGMGFAASEGGAGAMTSFTMEFLPAPELPVTPADAYGVFVERKDNSVFIGTGNIVARISSSSDSSSSADFSLSHDGPVVEVVIPQDTKIYRDTTQSDAANMGDAIQQQVEPSSIEEITPQSTISVWGRKVGDRLIADTIVFSTTDMIAVPADR